MGAFDQPEIIVQLDSVGEIRLRILLAGDTQYLFDTVARKNLTDKEFVQAILFHQLTPPKITEEAFGEIPGEDLKKLAAVFIENEEYTFKEYIDTGDIFADFRRPITQYVEEEEKRFRAMYGPTIKQAEQLARDLNRSGVLAALRSIDMRILVTTAKGLTTSLDTLGILHIQSLSGVLAGNIQATSLYNQYWRNYYTINARILEDVVTTFSAYLFSPQKDLERAILEVSRLSIKNERIFTGNIRQINTHPKEQRGVLYKKAGISFFSVHDFETTLQNIKKAVERNSQRMFWEKRTKGKEKGKLRGQPENIAQELMMLLLDMELPNRKVVAFQQLRSGAGIVDILLIFPNEYGELEKIILELKVFEDGHRLNDGIEQLAQYMEREETEDGYRVIFNATTGKLEKQNRSASNGKAIKDVIININLPNPSSLD